MKVINTIAALTCVGYALHYTDILPASQYEVYVSRAASSLRSVVDNAIRSSTTLLATTAEAPKPCPPTECKREVVRTVSETPAPQAVVVTVPAMPAAPVVAQPTWPSLALFQSQPAVATPAAQPALQPVSQPAPQPAEQPSTATFSSASPVITAASPAVSVIEPAKPVAIQERVTIRTEPAVAKPTIKPAGSEGTEKPAKVHKAATTAARAKTAGKRPAEIEATRPQSDWVASAMSRG